MLPLRSRSKRPASLQGALKRTAGPHLAPTVDERYPMYLISVPKLLTLDALRPHQVGGLIIEPTLILESEDMRSFARYDDPEHARTTATWS